jgi:hypothetical protein
LRHVRRDRRFERKYLILHEGYGFVLRGIRRRRDLLSRSTNGYNGQQNSKESLHVFPPLISEHTDRPRATVQRQMLLLSATVRKRQRSDDSNISLRFMAK